MLPKHQEKSLKVLHLNIRSLNNHCHELMAFLSCLNCNFDILLLTEIGNANKELIENVFTDYTHYCEHSIFKKGGAGILIKNIYFYEIEISENKVKLNCTNIAESIFVEHKNTIETPLLWVLYTDTLLVMYCTSRKHLTIA